MWLKNTVVLLLLFRAGQGNQGCSGRPNDSCPYQDVYTRTRDITEIPKSVASIISEMFFVETSLVEIREGAFQNMPNLVKIEFITNKIRRVEAGAFDNLEKLEDLEITGAELDYLPVGTFRSLSHLRRVNLRDSHIKRIEKGLFDNLGNLEELYLHLNEIPSLPDGVFDGLPKLTLLHLAMNKISNIPQDIFKQLTQLKTLRLQKNEITSLAEGSLDSLQDLMELNLQNNRFQTLPPNLLRQLANLEKLFLDHNLIEVLPDEIFLGLRKMKRLMIASNRLKAVPALGAMPLLKELDLSKNKLSSLENLASASLPTLEILKLQGNLLESVPTGQFDHLGKLTSLYLGGNPWRCDCHLFYLHQWINNNTKRIKDANMLICRSPSSLAGKGLSSLTKDQLVCLTTTPTLTNFKVIPLPMSASPSATSGRKSMAGALVHSTMLHGTTTSGTSATAPQTNPAKSRQVMATSRSLPGATLISPHAPASSYPVTPTQGSTSTRTSPEITSHRATASTSTPTTTEDVTTVPEVSSASHQATASTSSPTTTEDVTTVPEVSSASHQATASTSSPTTTEDVTTVSEVSSTRHEATTSTSTPTTTEDVTTVPEVSSTSHQATGSTSSPTTTEDVTTVPEVSSTSHQATTSWQISTSTSAGTCPCTSNSLGVRSSRPSAPEISARQVVTVPSPTPSTARLAQTLIAGPATVLPSTANHTFCSPSSLPPSPQSAGSPLSPSPPSVLPLRQAWGFSLSSNHRYCQVFLLLYLSMLCVDIFCAIVLGRLAYALHTATRSVKLPSRPVRLVHIRARKGRL